MDDVITRAEHEEFKKRIEDENHRQDRKSTRLNSSHKTESRMPSSA